MADAPAPKLNLDELNVAIRAPLEGLKRDLMEANGMLDKFAARGGVGVGVGGGARSGRGGGFLGGLGGITGGLGALAGLAGAAGRFTSDAFSLNAITGRGGSSSFLGRGIESLSNIGGGQELVRQLDALGGETNLLNLLLGVTGGATLATSLAGSTASDELLGNLNTQRNRFELRSIVNPSQRAQRSADLQRSALNRQIALQRNAARVFDRSDPDRASQLRNLADETQRLGLRSIALEEFSATQQPRYGPQGVNTAIGAFNVAPAIDNRPIDVFVANELGVQ